MGQMHLNVIYVNQDIFCKSINTIYKIDLYDQEINGYPTNG